MCTRALLLSALAATAIALGACGEEGEGDEASTQPAPAATAPATTDAQTPPEATNGAADRLAERIAAQGRPEIPRPAGDPPTVLQVADVKRGDGAALQAGDTIRVQYAGASWSTGEEFDASYGRGEPFEFALGAGMVIPGWDQGLEGMRVGGRRVLVIPPDLAYGAQGSPPVIGPNETLVFVVDAEGRQGAG